MKFRSAIGDQCVTVYTTDNRSFRVWKSSMIELWDERNRVWKYAYDLLETDKKELLEYAEKHFFLTKEVSPFSEKYTDVVSNGGMDPRNKNL
jgi:hypothetical protein